MIAGEITVDLVPQGTLAERIRAAGFGLGGVLTATGVGTLAAEGAQEIVINGRKFLVALPITADFALIGAHRADYLGNLSYALTARNFNPIMAMAGKTVVAEPAEIVPVGVIPPDDVITPGTLVDHFVQREIVNGR
jgi:acetate CoA/acetoacetate CoA-transferase alpha subunit